MKEVFKWMKWVNMLLLFLICVFNAWLIVKNSEVALIYLVPFGLLAILLLKGKGVKYLAFLVCCIGLLDIYWIHYYAARPAPMYFTYPLLSTVVKQEWLYISLKNYPRVFYFIGIVWFGYLIYPQPKNT